MSRTMTMDSNARVVVLDRQGAVPRAMTVAQAADAAGVQAQGAPALAAALRARGAAAVAVLDAATANEGGALHWLDAVHARGWVRAAAGADVDPETFPTTWAANLAAGFVPVDAALLAWPALPWLSWGDAPPPAPGAAAAPAQEPALGIYAIVDDAPALKRVLQAGVRTVQLRMKRPHDADAAWEARLRAAIADSLAAARDHRALCVVNDHWRIAAELGAPALHLGQDDLMALGDAGRAALAASGLSLGVSSHAVWELCRARALRPGLIACGPVWPTTTKDMPWFPQGLDNLAWWCRVAGAPVVAIGGILAADQVRQTAACGAAAVCVLRGLGDDPAKTVPALQAAFDAGHAEALARAGQPVARLHPTLDPNL